MTRPADVLAAAAELGAQGAPVALVTVVEATGSTPRHAGARMLVREDGGIVGTIGGGKIELEVIAAARPVASGTKPAESFARHLTRDLAMCCGGRMELWLEPLGPGGAGGARWKAIAEALRRRARRRPAVLAQRLDGMDVLAEDECLKTRKPRREGERFFDPILPAERLVLFGGGHVAQALAPMAAAVGFDVVVCDDDPAFVAPERFPGAAALVATFDAREAARELGGLGAEDHVIILTRDHAVDQAILEQLIGDEAIGYLGMIGSRGKVGRFHKRLAAKGLGDETRWTRLHAPVGLDIGAETPEEIAVAIVAELVAHRRRPVSEE